jgi:serine/threonine protein kinase
MRNIIRRLTDKRQVKHIASSLLEDSTDRTLDESHSSSDVPWLRVGSQPEDISASHAPAPLHRKELELGDLLGEGGFSQVFALEDLKLKMDDTFFFTEAHCVARRRLGREKASLVVKHLNRRLLKKPSQFKQAAIDLEHEAQLLSYMDHPNIVTVQGIAMGGLAKALSGGNYEDYFVVMDRLSETLDVRIERWNVEEAAPTVMTKLEYGRQIASALNYLHKKSLIFRDVKPHNIGFRKDANGGEHLQLFDFGLCRALPSQEDMDLKEDCTSFHMSIAGTPRYMSPEMHRGDSYGTKADVYSWAITLHEILSQERPFGHILKTQYLAEYVGRAQCRPPLKTLAFFRVPQDVTKLLEQSWVDSTSNRLNMADVLHRLLEILAALAIANA